VSEEKYQLVRGVAPTSRRTLREWSSGRDDREEDGGMTEVKAMLTWGIVWINCIKVKVLSML